MSTWNQIAKAAIALLCLAFACGASAQDSKERSEAQKKQQALINECNQKAGNKKGDERKIFMSTCLKQAAGAQSAAQKQQQARMSACNKQAVEKKLKGEERKTFIDSCLKN
jgi:hypothetical protein